MLYILFFCQCILVLLSATALVVILRHRMICRDLSSSLSQCITIPELVDRMHPGDIVYMCSRKLAWYDAYVAFLNVTGKTPYFHVFLVLPNYKMAHFVHSNYLPSLTSICDAHPESRVRSADLYEYLSSRQSSHPLYKIYRRTTTMTYEAYLSSCENTCHVGFAGLWHTLFSSSKKEKLHCNSFTGLMLQKIGLLPSALLSCSNNLNKEFTPFKMQTKYLGEAGYDCTGIFYTT